MLESLVRLRKIQRCNKMGELKKTARQGQKLFAQAKWCCLVRTMIVLLLGGLSFCLMPNETAFGQWQTAQGLQENFDSDQPSWEMLNIDPDGRFLERARVSDVAISGKCETYLCDFGSNGIYFVGHSILLPSLIDDLNVSIWVRSQETRMICTLEVVLPKSTCPDGKPVTLLLPGSQYTNIGEWQRLGIKANLNELEQQAKNLRLELHVPIDTSQAYVRRLVLCCYVTGKTSRIWIDDLQANGILTISPELRRIYEAEPVFNPKNVLWLFRRLGLYQTTTASINVEVEPTAIADVNWTHSQKPPQLPTISRNDPQMTGFRLQASGESFNHQPRSLMPEDRSLFVDNPIMLVADGGNNPAVFYPNDGNTTGNTFPGPPGRTTIQPADTAIARASFEPGIGRENSVGSFSSYPAARLTEQSELFRPANAGEFLDYILEDRISRGKPHDGCKIAAQQKMLWINGNLPYGVRAVEYRGEPLSFLVGLQFNTIWMRQPPSEALLEEAWKLGVWVICPPPDSESLRLFVNFLSNIGMTEDGKRKDDGNSLGIIGRMFARNHNPILAWDIGQNLTSGQIEQVRQYVGLVRDADLYRRIPFVCSAESGTRDYSYFIDVLLIDRHPILSSLELSDYNAWLNTKANWARKGTPNWCTIQTQPTNAMAHQWRLFGVGEIPTAAVSEEHVRLQVRMAMANECHGVLFASNSRLDANNAETKYRAALLELVNMELLLVEGWFSTSGSPQYVKSSSAGVNGVLLETNRARLLLPNVTTQFGQYVMGNTNFNNVDFLMPGTFETHQANHIMPGGTRPLTLRRITGGVQVHFDEVNTTTAAFFAQAEPILRAVIPRSRQPELSRRSAELAMELATMRLEQVRKTIRAFQEIQASPEGLPHYRNGFPMITMPEQESMLQETKRSIDTAESYYRQGDYSSAYLQAHRSITGLQYYERLKWMEAISNTPHHNINMIPTSVSFVTLPAYIEMMKKMYRVKPGENRLPTGDGENAALWQQAGWRSLSVPTDGVSPTVMLADPSAAYSGNGGIVLRLTPNNTTTLVSGNATESDNIQLETAPVWVTTPQIPVYAGETLCITGYVNIPQKLRGNIDGLMIFDSLGGESLALRMTDTGGQWQQFVFYRAVPTVVPPQATMCVTFSLGGLGEVRLDDLKIFPIIPDPDAPPPTTGPQSPNSGWLQFPELPRLW